MALAGWPAFSQNFASNLRNLRTSAGTDARVAMAIPRPKFTFLIEMTLNPYASIALSDTTSVVDYIKNGHIYGQLKSIDYPRPRFDTETIRSYNRYRKVYKKMQYDPATLVWTDDSTSMIQSLMKLYISFYHETGSIGSTNVANDDQEINTELGIIGSSVRTGMSVRPSLGMKLRPQYMRHFFQSITIYDLGTEPTSIGVHTFNTPVIINFDHDGLDWYSTDMVTTRWTLEYESYFFATSQNVDDFSGVLDTILGGNSNS
jgi:hypothetical protein